MPEPVFPESLRRLIELAAPWLPASPEPVAWLLFLAGALQALMVLLAPWAILAIHRRVRFLARKNQELETMIHATHARLGEVKDLVSSLGARMAHPSGPDRHLPRAPVAADPGPGEPVDDDLPKGQAAYAYCSECREIRFIKFSRCQSCGYHLQ